jgi:hypothetical protein
MDAAPKISRPQIRRSSIYLTAGVLLLLLIGFLSIPFLPWVMGIVGDVPEHVYLAELPQVNGAYLITDQGVLPLFTWYMPTEEIPEDSPVLDGSQVQSVIVIQAQHFSPEQYQLIDMERDQQIQWISATFEGKQARLVAERLLPGDYMLIQPTTGMFGGSHYFYFRIR